MALDLTELQALVDQLKQETSEAETAKVEMETRAQEATAANNAAQAAMAEYTLQNDEKMIKMQEIIARLEAALTE